MAWAMSVSRDTFVCKIRISRYSQDLSHRLAFNRVVERAVESFLLNLYYQEGIGLAKQLEGGSYLENTRFMHKKKPAA